MSYHRVIPRDLFNEAMLLKCLGRVWILLEQTPGHRASMDLVLPKQGFDIRQDPSSGNIYASNITFHIVDTSWVFEHPLNSRDPWPLILTPMTGDDEEVPVFTDDGEFTQDMLQLINP